MDYLVAIIAIVSTIALPIVLGIVFAMRENKNKHIERMEMIKQGLMPVEKENSIPNRMKTLRTGLILCGVGLGLFVGFISKRVFHVNEDDFGLVMGGAILLFLSLAYLIYYQISKKSIDSESN